MTTINTNCLIIGAGPAGYTSAIYTSRANLKPVLVEGLQPGGQLTTTTDIENFPGYPAGISGPKMMEDFRAQAQRFGAEIISGEVTSVDFSKRPFTVNIDGGATVVNAATVIICTGATAKYLGLPDEERFRGLGVSACATCDGFFFRGKPIVVVGGGDSAMEEAGFLSRFGSSVTLLHRRDQFRASQIMVDRTLENPAIDVMMNTVVERINGDGKGVTSVSIRNVVSGETGELPANGVFIAAGQVPQTAFLGGALELDDHGYIVVEGASTRTNVPGVFAAGDCADPVYQQAISAAGTGCRAALDVQAYLESLVAEAAEA